MVILAGSLEVDPSQRETYINGLIERMHITRKEPGCLEYTYSADPTNPGRVMIIERWASMKDLEAHAVVSRARPAVPGAVKPRTQSAFIYDVTGERPLG